VSAAVDCRAGHRLPGPHAACRECRRQAIIEAVCAADPTLPIAQVAAAVDTVAIHPAVLRGLAAAVDTDPNALVVGAPPVIGRLLTELRAVGSVLPVPGCVRCGRTDRPLTRSDIGGVCPRCRRRQLATACTRCGVIKPIAARDEHKRPVCARCADRPQRRCGRCGRIRRIAIRATDTEPDICDGCYQGHPAVCVSCQRRRPCAFLAEGRPTCQNCRPRTTVACAHCGQDRSPSARWPEGPVCDPCYTAALRRRGVCTGCGQLRRLVAPPGPDATTCIDCAALPTSHLRGHVCTDCGIEDKLYERGRCAPCAQRRRTGELLRGSGEQLPAQLTAVYQAITATATPRSALNWLRKGAGARLLAELAAGDLATTHEALDAHPRRHAAHYLRQLLVANPVLPPRDEALARTEWFLADTLAGIASDTDRRLVATYATWRVLRRLRRCAERSTRPRTYTRHAHLRITAAARFLAWLAQRDTTLTNAEHADIDDWLATGPAAYDVRDFLLWAAERGHCYPFVVSNPGRNPGAATNEDQRFSLLTRLLHDEDLELTDRVGGALLLLYGQQLSRITTMTTDQITRRGEHVFLRLGRDDIAVPQPLAGLLIALARNGRHTGIGTPAGGNWLFPGHLPGQPLTAARLGERLRTLGIHAQAGRRATLTALATQLPAAVLADLLHLHPTTAVRWIRDAGGNWNRYAAQLTQTHNHQP
jgi:hypothetical protein